MFGLIYMICQMTNPSGETFPIEITLDEQNQNVTISIPATGKITRRQAQFKADRILVPESQLVTYDFDRVGGTLVRYSPMLKRDIDSGQCQVSTTPARKF